MRMCFMCSRKCRFCNPRPYIRCCNALVGLCGWNERLADKIFRFSPHFKWLCLFNNPSVLIHRIWLWTGWTHQRNKWMKMLFALLIHWCCFFYQNSKRNVPTIHFSEHWILHFVRPVYSSLRQIQKQIFADQWMNSLCVHAHFRRNSHFAHSCWRAAKIGIYQKRISYNEAIEVN